MVEVEPGRREGVDGPRRDLGGVAYAFTSRRAKTTAAVAVATTT
jgi:hypothetical protein